MVTRTLRDLPKDLDKNISRDFNTLIKKVHRTLSTKKHSPVYTGFFASSWKVQSSPIKANDFIQNYQPWKGIKREATRMFLASSVKENKPKNPVIEPRYPVKRAFNYKRPVYIGDTVTATIEVKSIEKKSRIIVFKTFCKVRNKLVIDGSARIYIPKPKN